jgi:hypothetical protein
MYVMPESFLHSWDDRQGYSPLVTLHYSGHIGGGEWYSIIISLNLYEYKGVL